MTSTDEVNVRFQIIFKTRNALVNTLNSVDSFIILTKLATSWEGTVRYQIHNLHLNIHVFFYSFQMRTRQINDNENDSSSFKQYINCLLYSWQ